MNRKQKALFVVVAITLCVAVLWFWWSTRTSERIMEQPASTETPVPAGPNAAPGLNQGSSSAQPPAPPPTQKPSPELQRTFEALNHSAIEFYGRAIDQFGEAVVGADVCGTVLVNTGTRGGQMKVQTTTDAQGNFEFHGVKGQDLGVGISKEGYEYNPRHTSFSYSYFEADHKRHIPDPKNPVVFPLWKKQGAERLIHYSTGMDIPADGSPVRIDLATGKIGGAQSDLAITLTRTPLQMRYGTSGYAWTASIEVAKGGMVRAGERDYYNIAPEAGYVPRFEYAQSAVDFATLDGPKADWREHVKEDVFLTSLDGKRFARVRIDLYACGRNTNDTIGTVALTVWLNPNGSRNLEFDPAKAITSKP